MDHKITSMSSLPESPQLALWRLTSEIVPVKWALNCIPLKGFGMVHSVLIVAAGYSLPHK